MPIYVKAWMADILFCTETREVDSERFREVKKGSSEKMKVYLHMRLLYNKCKKFVEY